MTLIELLVEVRNARMLTTADNERADKICEGIKALSARLSAASAQGEDFRKMVLAMHAAARGEAVSPNRGLVRDVEDLRASAEAMRKALEEILEGEEKASRLGMPFSTPAIVVARRALEGAKP